MNANRKAKKAVSLVKCTTETNVVEEVMLLQHLSLAMVADQF